MSVVVVGNLLFFPVPLLNIIMAGLEDLWAKFTLTEDEEGGADVPNQEVVGVHRLAGKFFTKRVLNVEAVARTFKPLWKPVSELKIHDLGETCWFLSLMM